MQSRGLGFRVYRLEKACRLMGSISLIWMIRFVGFVEFIRFAGFRTLIGLLFGYSAHNRVWGSSRFLGFSAAAAQQVVVHRV